MTLSSRTVSVLARAAGVSTALAVAGALAGCVSLFPKAPPAQLYRFEPEITESSAPPSENRIPVSLSAVAFTQAGSGDRILTMTGDEAAYIEGARWVAPAESLFEEAMTRAFAGSAVATRLVERRQSASAKMVLNVTVERFEARYEAGPKAAPTVVVALRAQLIRFPDRAVVGAKSFRAEQSAADNRVSAIVAAYDQDVTSVLKDLTAWTDQTATQGQS
jgi:cholesterol transport system auxiliary component